MEGFQRIIISRTDSIGDVVLSLPVAAVIRKSFPEAKIHFLGRSYTRAVIDACEYIDGFMNWDEIQASGEAKALHSFKEVNADLILHIFPRKEIARLAKKAEIPVRLGTTNRLYHWTSCNKLVRLSRKKSSLHEAQLNLKLVEGITGMYNIPIQDISKLYGLSNTELLEEKFRKLIHSEKYNLILHPKSKGSAREWGMDNFRDLIKILPENDFNIFISGTKEEGALMENSGIFDLDGLTNLCGQMSLAQLMSFIKACDGLVAASTGPLHLAAALGINALGIYPPIKPMHPGRWAPIGEKANYLVKEKECSDCREKGPCHCITDISPRLVKEQLMRDMKPGNP
jgi:ADP-heptose:LPS heptosyltransferase